MLLYILDHKLATASIIAAGGGLGAFLEENMDDDTRAVVMVVGLFGLAYCVDGWENAKECATVTAELGIYYSKIRAHEEAIRGIDSRLYSLSKPLPPPADVVPRTPPPNLLVGSDAKGPFYDSEYPTGYYISGDAQIRLVVTVEQNVSRSMQRFDIRSLKKKAEAATSNLHEASGKFRYLLLEKDSLAILKHSVMFRDYSNLSPLTLGVGIETSKNSGKWPRIAYVIRSSPAESED